MSILWIALSLSLPVNLHGQSTVSARSNFWQVTKISDIDTGINIQQVVQKIANQMKQVKTYPVLSYHDIKYVTANARHQLLTDKSAQRIEAADENNFEYSSTLNLKQALDDYIDIVKKTRSYIKHDPVLMDSLAAYTKQSAYTIKLLTDENERNNYSENNNIMLSKKSAYVLAHESQEEVNRKYLSLLGTQYRDNAVLKDYQQTYSETRMHRDGGGSEPVTHSFKLKLDTSLLNKNELEVIVCGYIPTTTGKAIFTNVSPGQIDNYQNYSQQSRDLENMLSNPRFRSSVQKIYGINFPQDTRYVLSKAFDNDETVSIFIFCNKLLYFFKPEIPCNDPVCEVPLPQ